MLRIGVRLAYAFGKLKYLCRVKHKSSMKDFKNDSTATLSRFGKDKRTRTVKVERVERRPRMTGDNEGNEHGAEQPRRRSFNPNFDRDNRPIHDNNRGEHRSRSYDGDRNPEHGHSYGRSFAKADHELHGNEEHRDFEHRPSAHKPGNGKRSFRKSEGFNAEKPFRKEGGFSRKEGKATKQRNNGFGPAKRDNAFPRKRNDRNQSESRPQSYPKYNPNKQTGEMRLNRFIAQSGICSRREADDFIKAGLVSVNGTVVTELGTKVMPTDEVRFNDSIVQGEKKVYLVLNKPKGYVTTLDDPHATKTVMDLVKDACTERIYPVGRLDKNSLGLLLFTNDGDLTKQLTHPSYKKKKIYQVTLDKPLTRADMDKIAEGITLEDGDIYADEISYVKDDKKEIGIEIHSGRNRIVRRIFEHLGYTVQKLDRVYYAGLTKKNLKRGAWRFLTKDEVIRLKTGQYE